MKTKKGRSDAVLFWLEAGEWGAGEELEVEVGNFLPGIFPRIADEAVTGLLHAEFGGDLVGDDEHVAQEGGVGLGSVL